LKRVVDVKPEEVRAMFASFAFFFFVLSSYFILRPMRDAVGVAAGVSGLSWLFGGTLAAMLCVNPLFSTLVVRFPVRRFIPLTYHFFAASLLVFYFVNHASGADAVGGSVWAGRVFYIWTSVYNLFVVSVFWCFMADVFRSEQAKRLFGFIGVGGTLGSITGSGLTAALAAKIGTVNLLLVSAVLLEIGVLIVSRFPAPSLGVTPGSRSAQDEGIPIGGSVWAGMTQVMRSPYLLGIAVFLVLYTVGSTFLYFEQADIIGRYYQPAQRTEILAKIEFSVQVVTVITQVFLTGRVIRWLGLGVTLALLPAATMIGFGALGLAPVMTTLTLFVVARRGTNFGLTNPAMEALFTVVSREDKYKAKSFIETFVYRAGDQIGAWVFAGLTALGLSISANAFVAVPIAGGWLVLALWLGRKHAQLAGERTRVTPPAPEAVPAT
jgi:AAA family ATP:ADP antiporter